MDARGLVIAMLVIWANVHGTVVMGVALAMLCGVFAANRPSRASRRPALALLC